MLSPAVTGWLIWLVWVLIGALCAIIASRFPGGRRSLWFDIIIGAVSAVIGGYLSTQYLGNTAMQHFLVSILAAVFSAALMMWVVGGLIAYFRKKEE